MHVLYTEKCHAVIGETIFPTVVLRSNECNHFYGLSCIAFRIELTLIVNRFTRGIPFAKATHIYIYIHTRVYENKLSHSYVMNHRVRKPGKAERVYRLRI